MRQLILCFLLLVSVSSRAQFFSFGFPQFEERQQRKEKYTAPSYKGGDSAVEAFIQKQYHNPSPRKEVDGRIVVAVIVDKKGKVRESEVIQGLTDELNKEALRVARKMKFAPATRGKKKVDGRVDVVFPIRRGKLSFMELSTVDV
ncbi:MAG: energy transducer TonB [Bacteroidaceae bacterium]|nr:energy transducer TonB [Bacteroidaceae bacterium]